jgi:hypothetical protein
MDTDMQNLLDDFGSRLTGVVIQICNSKGFDLQRFFSVDELDEKWDAIAPAYLADAVREFNDYPTVALAWAGYVGMGIAKMWDSDWEFFANSADLYASLVQPRGFDAMDEFVTEELYGFAKDSSQYASVMGLWQQLADSGLTLMRRENLMSQSVAAYHLLATTVKVFFLAGITIGLASMGYRYEKMDM